MTCQECRELWSSLLDRELAIDRIEAVKCHLRDCADCRRECCELSCVDAAARSLEVPVSSEAWWKDARSRLAARLSGDAELAAQAKAGDRPAFEQLARRYQSAALALAFCRTGDRQEADALAQEVLDTARRELPGLSPPEAFPSWLKDLTVQACRRWSRSRPWPPLAGSNIPEGRHAIPVEDPSPAARLERRAQRQFQQTLLILPEANRVAFLARRWGKCSEADLAAFLGVEQATLEGRLQRTTWRLRHLLPSTVRDQADLPYA